MPRRSRPVTQREALAVLLAPLFATPRRIIVLGVVVLAVVVSAAHAGTSSMPAMTRAQLTEYVQNLVGGQRQDMERLAALERACMPRYTGGGVTQCAQPSIPEVRLLQALEACFSNGAYVGGTQEDTWALHAQCLNDWNDAHPVHP